MQARSAFRRALVCGLAIVCNAGTAGAEAWPTLRLPANASSETVATDMVLDGKPCRVVGYDAHGSEDQVIAFYRSEFGPMRVENRLKADRVIATRQGDYFITVRLRARDDRTVGGTAMTTLVAGKPISSGVLIDTKKLLPTDTQVVSTVQTDDSGKRSLVIVGVNRNSLQANRDHVVGELAARGFRPSRQGSPQDANDATSVFVQLSSTDEEAAVTVSDAGAYRSVVINRVRGGT